MTATDATRFAGESYRTRMASGAAPDDKTRIAQEGYKSKLARDAAGVQPDASEFYKMGEIIGGRYEVSAIHHGGMGVVYGCFDHQTKLPRALKTVRNRYAHDKQMLSLFESEASVWISLEKHPYIVRAYLVERFNNLPYVIAEYISGPEGMGGDLCGWLGHPRLTLPVAVTMALQIAQGMQHAVRKVPNLVHRDLKPSNILVSGDGKAMVTDFGLVNAVQSGAGTPAYMSPEQWRSEALDPRSDIYSYGCILFEMFTAHRLFPALSEQDWESAHLNSVPAALTSIVPELPSAIDRFVRRCLEKEPRARPQRWDEIVATLAEWYHRLTGNVVILDFSSLTLDSNELFNAGYSLSNLNRYEESLSAYNRALAIDPTNFAVWVNKGASLCNLKRNEEAILACDRALAINPNYAKPWTNKGIALYDLKRNEEAIQAHDRALAIDPNYAAAWNNKGLALYNLKRYEEAIQAYDRALAIDNNDAAWMNKATTLCRLNRYEEAIHAYDGALAIDPNDADALMNKGNALYDLKRYEESLSACNRALEIDPNHAYAWNSKGNTLSNLNRHEEAIQAYDRALAIAPNYANAWYNKGNTLSYLKRYEEAIQSYDHALAIDNNDSGAWMKMGLALCNLKRHEAAIHAYDQVLAINPNYALALCNKGNSLRELKRYEEAIQAFNRALTIDPTNDLALRGSKIASDALKAAK